MDFLNEIINTIKTSPNPEIYYLAGAAVLILVFYLVNKVLKIITFCLIVGILAFGLAMMQGKDSGEIITSLKASFDKVFSGTSSSISPAENSSYITGTKKRPESTDDSQSTSSSSIQKYMSDMLSKFSNKQ